jgi:hypothetical protein
MAKRVISRTNGPIQTHVSRTRSGGTVQERDLQVGMRPTLHVKSGPEMSVVLQLVRHWLRAECAMRVVAIPEIVV